MKSELRKRQFPISRKFLASAATVAFALALAGCGHSGGEDHSHADSSDAAEYAQETEAGVSFSAKKGLFVPPTTGKFIGLQVADVEERKVASAIHFSAQVYRTASEARFASIQSSAAPDTLASGGVAPAEAARLHEGQVVSVQSGVDGVSLPGRIVALKRDREKAGGEVEVLLGISDAKQPLASGAFASVTVPLGGEKSVASVPRSAVFRTLEGDFVYTVSGDRFVRTQVKLEVVNHDFAEVTDGLYAGDQIVVKPVMTLWLAELQSIRGGKACADGY